MYRKVPDAPPQPPEFKFALDSKGCCCCSPSLGLPESPSSVGCLSHVCSTATARQSPVGVTSSPGSEFGCLSWPGPWGTTSKGSFHLSFIPWKSSLVSLRLSRSGEWGGRMFSLNCLLLGAGWSLHVSHSKYSLSLPPVTGRVGESSSQE